MNVPWQIKSATMSKILLFTLATLFCPSPLAWGKNVKKHPFIIYVTRLGGDEQIAKPYIEKFVAYIEQKMGWPKKTLQGRFLTRERDVLKAITEQKPSLAVLEPPLYFKLSQTIKMIPLAVLEGKDLVSKQVHLIVSNKRVKTIDDLKGKTLWTTFAESPLYLSRVVFKGKIDAQRYFTLHPVRQALKAVRAVLTGKADAAIIDNGQWTHAKKLKGGNSLRVIFTSDKLPALPVVAFPKSLNSQTQNKLVSVLTKLCKDKQGAAICREMFLDRFAVFPQALFKTYTKLYQTP